LNALQQSEVDAWCPRKAVERFAEAADVAGHPTFDRKA
jgi:hypothetical protein